MRRILFVISILLFVNCILIFLRSGPNNTFLLNMGLFAGTGLYTLFFDRLWKTKWLNFLICFLAMMYLSIGVFAMIYGRTDTVTFNEDAAIVLGSGLRGEEVSLMLQKRLDAAVEYHFKNPSALIIVSGGQGPGDAISEALAMARYLEAHGVPPELILQEGRSHSTYQNMRLSMVIIEENFDELPQVVVITNDFHIYRAVSFTRIVGLEGATSFHGNTPLAALPGALVREVAAIVKMWLIGT